MKAKINRKDLIEITEKLRKVIWSGAEVFITIIANSNYSVKLIVLKDVKVMYMMPAEVSDMELCVTIPTTKLLAFLKREECDYVEISDLRELKSYEVKGDKNVLTGIIDRMAFEPIVHKDIYDFAIYESKGIYNAFHASKGIIDHRHSVKEYRYLFIEGNIAFATDNNIFSMFNIKEVNGDLNFSTTIPTFALMPVTKLIKHTGCKDVKFLNTDISLIVEADGIILVTTYNKSDYIDYPLLTSIYEGGYTIEFNINKDLLESAVLNILETESGGEVLHLQKKGNVSTISIKDGKKIDIPISGEDFFIEITSRALLTAARIEESETVKFILNPLKGILKMNLENINIFTNFTGVKNLQI